MKVGYVYRLSATEQFRNRGAESVGKAVEVSTINNSRLNREDSEQNVSSLKNNDSTKMMVCIIIQKNRVKLMFYNIFSTSDYSDVLLLSKVPNIEF